MEMNRNTRYDQLALPEDLLTSFAKAMAPEIKKFYESETGKAYYHDWLLRHPEYQQPDTPNGMSGCSVHSSKNDEVSIL